VELNLSDGDSLLLLQTISASGARYTNTGETYIFWNKGDTAFLQEGSRNTYEDCVVVPAE
ncbi:MAG: MliC family protein, partial [Candidatus Pacearchaeota archaeon]